MRARLKLAFVAVALLSVVMALANTQLQHDVHEWRHDGACLDCHSRQGDVELKSGWSIPPPSSHSEQFRRYTHGKLDKQFQQCAACHRQTECQSCHDRAPESHTVDFMQPHGIGMERHILLATIRPATCLTCHDAFVTQCASCHTAAELRPWEQQARQQGMNWELRR